MDNVEPEVTACLRAMDEGNPDAPERLMELIYDDLRELAAGLFSQQRRDQTLQPTALVHEAYMRLVGNTSTVEGRRHFLNVAARAMRQILADHGRRRGSQKRGGGSDRVAIEVAEEAQLDGRPIEGEEFIEALQELEQLEPRQAQVFQLRYLSGMSIEEAAEVIQMSPRTVRLDTEMAKAWMKRRLGDGV